MALADVVEEAQEPSAEIYNHGDLHADNKIFFKYLACTSILIFFLHLQRASPVWMIVWTRWKRKLEIDLTRKDLLILK